MQIVSKGMNLLEVKKSIIDKENLNTDYIDCHEFNL